MTLDPGTNGFIGLIPAAGKARRIAPLPGSKELFPIGFDWVNGVPRPKPVISYLLNQYRTAGIRNVCIVVTADKWDIPRYLGCGDEHGVNAAFRVVADSPTPVHTLAAAYPWVERSPVMMGFPDMVFPESDVLRRLADQFVVRQPDVLLGLFPVLEPHKVDMVRVDDSGRVSEIVIKPENAGGLQFTWGLAAWQPEFSRFLRDYVASWSGESRGELQVGSVILEAARQGMSVEGVPVSGGPFLDIGTPDNLAAAVGRFGRSE